MYRRHAGKALVEFIDFLSKQDKIVMATDLLPSLHYTYISGIPGCIYRCNLWTGLELSDRLLLGDEKDYDAQINVEIDFVHIRPTYMHIAVHERGKRLDDQDSWWFEDD